MAFGDRVRAVFGMPPRRLKFSNAPVSIDTMFREMLGNTAKVGREEALSVPAVVRGRNMLAAPIGTLPLETVDEGDEVVVSDLLDGNIDPNVPNVVTMSQTVEDLIFDGVSYWRKTAYDVYGFPAHAQHLDPRSCSVNPPGDGRWQNLLPSGVDPRGYLWVEGRPVPWAEVIRFDSPNPPMLEVGADTIRLARAHAAAAKVYAEDPRPMDFITAKDPGYEPTDEELGGFFSRWARARRLRSMAYLPGSFEHKEVQQPTPADLQLLELKREDTLAVANLFGLDPEDFGVSTTSRTYQNAVDRRQDKINEAHAPYMTAITDRLSMDDVTWPGYRTRFDLAGYLKADPKTRSEVQLAYLAAGVMTVDEIRRAEGMPKIVAPRPPIRATVTVPAVETGEPMRQIEAATPAAHTFARETGLHFGAELDATFAVDAERRTVTGLAVPYGKVGMARGRKFRFAPGSLKYAAVNRVKLLRDHDNSQAVGKAISLTETPEGLVAKFSVSRGRRGDEVLALAEDEVLDGLSIGVDFREEDTVPDPENPGALLVLSAALREISLTAVPSFDDSRLTSVRASDEGVSMKCTKCNLVHAEGVTDCVTPDSGLTPVTMSGEQFTALLAKFSAGKPEDEPANEPADKPEDEPADKPAEPTAVTLSAEQFASMMGKAVPKPAVIIPPVKAVVKEALPYTFDRGGNFVPDNRHDFSTDLHAMAQAGDNFGTGTEFGKRVMGILKAEFATLTGDINELNPTIDRPDMYVDQRDYRVPLWESINKGAPPNGVQPFRFPKFNASSGLVGPHTEGVEPVAGAFTTTDQTVTPAALSGKATLTREVWDMGGNPAVSTLVYNQMRRGYREGLETATAAFLNTLTAAADIALGVGVVNAALQAAWDAAIADLQFIRGYDFDMFAVENVLYKAFVAAVDTSGKKLYAQINPSDANGRSTQRFRTLDLAGVEGVPSWALPSTAGALNNSWLYDRSTVWGWATGPQRLEFPGTAAAGTYAPVATVDLAIWGYRAFANTDIQGVRQVTYDSVV